MTSTDTFAIVVAVTPSAAEFHAPGCNHLNRKQVETAGHRNVTAEWLAEWSADAKSLGQSNPVKACLRKVIR